MLHLLAPTGAIRLAPLDIAVDGGSADLRQLLLQTGPSTYALVLWRNAKVWDQTKRREIAVDPVTVRVKLPAEVNSARVQQLDQAQGADEPTAGLKVAVSAMPLVVTLTK
jgi:hypothetical protein